MLNTCKLTQIPPSRLGLRAKDSQILDYRTAKGTGQWMNSNNYLRLAPVAVANASNG